MPIATSGNLLFSRYLSSQYLAPLGPRPRRDLRALVVVANPMNLAEYQLAAIDTAAELARVRKCLEPIPAEVLTQLDRGVRATLDNITARL